MASQRRICKSPRCRSLPRPMDATARPQSHPQSPRLDPLSPQRLRTNLHIPRPRRIFHRPNRSPLRPKIRSKHQPIRLQPGRNNPRRIPRNSFPSRTSPRRGNRHSFRPTQPTRALANSSPNHRRHARNPHGQTRIRPPRPTLILAPCIRFAASRDVATPPRRYHKLAPSPR